MHHVPGTLVLLHYLAALASASLFLPFHNALDAHQDAISGNEANFTRSDAEQELDLAKRQNAGSGCPSQYSSCQNLGAPQLCCADNAVCSADSAGYVACCPSGAACTGTITGVITSGTVPPGGSSVQTGSALAGTTTAAHGTSSTSNGMVMASNTATTTTSNGGFIISGTSTVAVPASAPRGMEVVSICSFFPGSALTKMQPMVMEMLAGLLGFLRVL